MTHARCEARLAFDLRGRQRTIPAMAVHAVGWGSMRAVIDLQESGALVYYYQRDGQDWKPACLPRELAPWRTRPLPFGGVRYMMACPGCARPCRVLYAGRERLRCRLCLALRYRSQVTRPLQRSLDRADKLLRRLDPFGLFCVLDGCPPRPKGMRQRTYRRLSVDFERHASRGCAWLAAGL